MMNLEEHRALMGFYFKVCWIDAHEPGVFPSLPSFIEEVEAHIKEGEANPADDLAESMAQEFAMRVEEELAEGLL